MQTQTVCPQCGGEGKIIKNKCSACGGEGIVYGEEVVTVKIPAGVAEGMQVTINGKGNAGKHNGVAGDLLVLIEEEKHPELVRDESDLIYNLLLSVPTAALGGTVEIPTIDGKAKNQDRTGYTAGQSASSARQRTSFHQQLRLYNRNGRLAGSYQHLHSRNSDQRRKTGFGKMAGI